MRFKGDIIITDPCYICNGDDWEKSRYGERMDILGVKNYISGGTGCGDCFCTTFNSDTNEPIGEFCADAGMVGVFLLEEVTKYNPDFDYHVTKPWTTTLIKDFDGEVEFKVEKGKLLVVGRGNINFIGRQTGL